MKFIKANNFRYSNASRTSVDCNVLTDELGWVPTTVDLISDDRPELIKMLEGVTIQPHQPPVIDHTVNAKSEKKAALQAMVFTGSSGVAIQCRPQDEQNMLSAIDIMKRKSLTTYDWYAADNTWTPVTIADLENAIISGQDQGAAIWETFRASGA